MSSFTLLTTLYNEKDSARCREYITCLENNIADSNIGSIIVFYEQETPDDFIYQWLLQHDIKIELIDFKPTFQYLFEYSNERLKSRNIVIANADIYYDHDAGLGLLEELKLSGKFLTLTRYNKMEHLTRLLQEFPEQQGRVIETKNNGTLRSQHLDGSSIDSWIFRTPLVMDFKSSYTMGVVSCDSCLNYRLERSKFLRVYNPCLDVVSIHEHNNWTPGKYSTVIDANGVERTRDEWTSFNLSQGDIGARIPFCRLSDVK